MVEKKETFPLSSRAKKTQKPSNDSSVNIQTANSSGTAHTATSSTTYITPTEIVALATIRYNDPLLPSLVYKLIQQNFLEQANKKSK